MVVTEQDHTRLLATHSSTGLDTAPVFCGCNGGCLCQRGLPAAVCPFRLVLSLPMFVTPHGTPG